MKNFIEQYREKSVKKALEAESVQGAFPFWIEKIKEFNPNSSTKIINLGSKLREINFFGGEKWVDENRASYIAENKDLEQAVLSRAGYTWERLVIYYLNLCLIGSNAVVFKSSNDLTPECIKDALTVKYGPSFSHSEADVLALIFPQKNEETGTFNINDDRANLSNSEFKKLLNDYVSSNFEKIILQNIQCKTNWNDSAQTILLWDIIYNIGRTTNIANLSIGKNSWMLRDLKSFSYAFATMPTQKKLDGFTPTKLPVVRVRSISGGNYWGSETKNNVASSISEIFSFYNEAFGNHSHRNLLSEQMEHLQTKFSYFNFPNIN